MTPKIEALASEFRDEVKKEFPEKEKVFAILKEMWDDGEDGQRIIIRSIINIQQGYYENTRPIVEGYVIPFCDLNKIKLTKKLLKKHQY